MMHARRRLGERQWTGLPLRRLVLLPPPPLLLPSLFIRTSSFRRLSAHVPQANVALDLLTGSETFAFAASLLHPESASATSAAVAALLADLGSPTSHTRGSPPRGCTAASADACPSASSSCAPRRMWSSAASTPSRPPGARRWCFPSTGQAHASTPPWTACSSSPVAPSSTTVRSHPSTLPSSSALPRPRRPRAAQPTRVCP